MSQSCQILIVDDEPITGDGPKAFIEKEIT